VLPLAVGSTKQQSEGNCAEPSPLNGEGQGA